MRDKEVMAVLWIGVCVLCIFGALLMKGYQWGEHAAFTKNQQDYLACYELRQEAFDEGRRLCRK